MDSYHGGIIKKIKESVTLKSIYMVKKILDYAKLLTSLFVLFVFGTVNAQIPGPGVDPDAVMLDDFESGDYGKWKTRPGSRGEVMSFELMDASNGDMVRFGNYALKVNIDFTNAQAQQTLVAQITPVATEDLQIPGNASGGKKLGMWLYATEGVQGMWVRVSTRPIGATSGVTNTDLASSINWTGWKYVECELPAGHEFHPDCIRFVVLKSYENYYVNDYVIIDNIRVTNQSFAEDFAAPVISSLTGNGVTLNGGTYTTSKIDISASFNDSPLNTSGINYGSVVINVDGNEFRDGDFGFVLNKEGNTVDLTGLSLSNGTHNVEVIVEDNFGNIATQRAAFAVNASDGKATVVTIERDDDVYVGTPYYLDIVTDNPKDIKELHLVLEMNNIGSVEPVGGVVFAESAAGSEYDFNARDRRLTMTIVNDVDAASDGKLASVRIDISKNSNPTDVLRCSPVSSLATYADNSLSLFSLFEAFSENVKASYDFAVNKRVVGVPGEITVTDLDGNVVSGATVYALSEDLQTVLDSKTTGADGVATEMSFTNVAQPVNIYVEKEGKYSYTRLVRTLNPLLTLEPEFIRSGVTPDPLTQKTITWMSNPLLSEEGSYIKIAKKTDGEAAFRQVEGKTKWLEYNAVVSSGVVKGSAATVTGLEPATVYIYQVGDGVNWSPTREFSTVADTDKFSFNAFGDLQASSTADMSRYIAAAKTTEEMETAPMFNLNVGDVVDSDDRYDFYSYYGYLFNQQPAFSNIDIISGYGNHEYMGNVDADNCKFINGHHSVSISDNYDARLVGTGSYAVEYGNMIVISLDWEHRGPESATTLLQEELKWVDEVLSKNTDKVWKVISLHYPIYPGESTPGAKGLFDPVLSKHGVQLVFCGHGHTYERVQVENGSYLVDAGDRRTFEPAIGGTMHIQLGDMTSTGRNGRWLHCDVDGKKMEVTVRDAANNVVEEECFTFYASELDEYEVDFAVSSGEGTLTAFVDGEEVSDGGFVKECSDVEFKAEPADGYVVRSWTINGETVESDAASYVVECISEDISVEVSFEKSGGISDVEGLQLSVYPNPCSDEVCINGAEGALLKVMDVSGSVLLTSEIQTDDEMISISGLADGFYFFMIENDGESRVLKVVKKSK